MKYDAVLFDKDGTLFEYVQPFERIWQSCLADRGFHSTPEAIIEVFVAATTQELGDDRKIDSDFAIYRGKWMRICLRALNNMSFAGDALEAAEAMWHGLVVEKSRPYGDAKTTLDALRSKALKLGVVSNHNITLEEALRGHGLETYFGAIVPSALVGVEKPDGRIFTHALRLLGVVPNRALFVGDDYEKDVVGACSVGMDAILLSRTGGDSLNDVPTIGSLADILEML
jgi:HAD superfamily hydrolase (TIGR01509 family)